MTLHNPVQIKLVPYGSHEYREMRALRARMANRTSGITPGSRTARRESRDYHICALRGALVVGALVLSPEKNAVHIHQLALEEDGRLLETGAQMLYFAEQIARLHGHTELTLEVQESSRQRYEALGYRTVATVNSAKNLTSVRMRKCLLNQGIDN